jgi:hypothetical protein
MQLPIEQIKINPEYEGLVPRVTAEEYQTMKESIRVHGIREPIVLNGKKIIIDGHTRFQIAKELGIKELPTRDEIYENPYLEKMTVIELNLHRRQLNTAQKCELGLKVLEFTSEEAKDRQLKTQLNGKTIDNLPITKSNKIIKTPQSSEVVKLLPPNNSSSKVIKWTSESNLDLQKPVSILTHETDPIKISQTFTEINQTITNGKAIEQAAEKVGVSASTLQHYKKMTEVAKTNPILEKERQEPPTLRLSNQTQTETQ